MKKINKLLRKNPFFTLLLFALGVVVSIFVGSQLYSFGTKHFHQFTEILGTFIKHSSIAVNSLRSPICRVSFIVVAFFTILFVRIIVVKKILNTGDNLFGFFLLFYFILSFVITLSTYPTISNPYFRPFTILISCAYMLLFIVLVFIGFTLMHPAESKNINDAE